MQARSSGVLAHLSSLPGAFGIGNLGPGARDFVDFLREAGFRYWQICPVGPTGYGDSPYQSFSSFAGNPYFLDLSELATHGWLAESDLAPLRALATRHVDYGALYARFWEILAKAYDGFIAAPRALEDGEDIETFRARHAGWLETHALFMALKRYHAGVAWPEWAPRFRDGPARARAHLTAAIQEEAERQVFYQYLFEQQWNRLRRYARQAGIEIIGDLPIFVALDSSDTWHWRDAFRLDAGGQPLASAGVPPDYFSERGQFWGNPLYDWEHLRGTDYAWWMARLQRAFDLFDVIRLDHFRGFDTYWEIPAGSDDARTGTWQQGPGMDFLEVVQQRLPQARIIAEDLGYITADVVRLRREAGYPGMKIVQFAYGHDDNNVNLPHFHTPDTVVYSGTHDNNTTRGWLEDLREPYATRVAEYFQLGRRASAWPIIRATLASPAFLAILPMQDLLNLGSGARMNRPGTSEGNWQWRFTPPQLTRLRAEKLDTLRSWQHLFDRDGALKQREYSAPPDTSVIAPASVNAG
jgi:4-alpha-glucanotransferase